MSSVLHRQYHACWCSGDFRSQGISRYGIDPQGWNIRSTASDELIVHYKCNIFLWNWLNAIRNLSALFILMASRVLQHQSISSHSVEYPTMRFLGADSIKRCHLTSIGNPIVDKTILRPSYLHNGIPYTGKMTSLYWIGAQMFMRSTHWGEIKWFANQ